jgi:hypothetical protein
MLRSTVGFVHCILQATQGRVVGHRRRRPFSLLRPHGAIRISGEEESSGRVVVAPITVAS